MLEAAWRRNTLSSSLFAPHAVRQLAARRETQLVANPEAALDRTPNARALFRFDALVWDIEVILI